MTREEQLAMGRRIQAGDVAAAQELALAFTALGLSIARRSRCRGGRRCEDRDQVAMMATMRAALAYDPANHGDCLFSTFARPRIASACAGGCCGCRRHWVQSFGEGADAEVVDHRERPESRAELVEQVAHTLPPDSAAIVVAHAGLDGEAPVPLTELAHKLGVSRQAVSQRYQWALARLKERLAI